MKIYFSEYKFTLIEYKYILTSHEFVLQHFRNYKQSTLLGR